MVSTLSRMFAVSCSMKSNNFSVVLSKSLIPFSLNFNAGKKSLAEELGIPDPPKRPLTAAFRYFIDPKNANRLTDISSRDKMSKMAEEWRNLTIDLKQPYLDQYQQEQEAYAIKSIDYKQSLTPEQMEELKELANKRRNEKMIRKARLDKKIELEKLERPKIPPSAVGLFLKSQEGKHKLRGSDFLKLATSEWRDLDQLKKQAFMDEATKSKLIYAEQMEIWETKMLNMGRDDLVRKATLRKSRAEENKKERKLPSLNKGQ